MITKSIKIAICFQSDITSIMMPIINITAARPDADMAFSFGVLALPDFGLDGRAAALLKSHSI